MTIYALDPGPERSALVCLVDGRLHGASQMENEPMRAYLTQTPPVDGILVIEQVESYGMPVGREVFETVFWSGRFAEAWASAHGVWTRLPRRAVKLHLCGSARATDATIRQALIDRFGPGKDKAIGRKAAPGALYGVKADLWAALALALTYQDSLGAGA